MPSVELEIRNNVAIVRFNKPEKFNAFDREMALLLQQILDDCSGNDAVRCIMITGNGKAFSAGQDISELTADNDITIDKILAEHFNPIVKRIREINKPVLCAVNGVAAGAGANIALCGDVVVATASATFIQAFSKIGLIPDSGGTFFLPRLVGFQKASALMMLGDKVTATDAERMGMIYKYFDEATFADEAFALAQQLADLPTQGLALTKLALNHSMHRTFDEQLYEEDILQRKAAATADYAEGIIAFIEKRKPLFTGK